MLFDGDGIHMNKKEAARYLKLACDMGDDESIYHYGYMLDTGDGIPIYKKEAAHYFKIYADALNYISSPMMHYILIENNLFYYSKIILFFIFHSFKSDISKGSKDIFA